MTQAQWKRQIQELCEELGWGVEREGNHMKLVKAGVKTVFCASTPSCHRAYKNTKARMLRYEREASVG